MLRVKKNIVCKKVLQCRVFFVFRVLWIISIYYNREWEMTLLRASYLMFALAPNTLGQQPSPPVTQNGRCFCNWAEGPWRAHTQPTRYSRPSRAPVAKLAASRWNSSAAMVLTANARSKQEAMESSPTDWRQRRTDTHTHTGRQGGSHINYMTSYHATLTLWTEMLRSLLAIISNLRDDKRQVSVQAGLTVVMSLDVGCWLVRAYFMVH